VAIEVVNRQRLVAIARDDIIRLAGGVIFEIGRPLGISVSADIVIAIVRGKQMRRLNCLYRGKDVETDVLSFPGGHQYNLADDFYLGDVVICADAALRQAGEAGLSIEREMAELVIHGVLHLAGYDHEVDSGEMNRLELKLRRRLLDSQMRSPADDAHGQASIVK
jgi:probable rRNA maturation factor